MSVICVFDLIALAACYSTHPLSVNTFLQSLITDYIKCPHYFEIFPSTTFCRNSVLCFISGENSRFIYYPETPTTSPDTQTTGKEIECEADCAVLSYCVVFYRNKTSGKCFYFGNLTGLQLVLNHKIFSGFLIRCDAALGEYFL